MPSRAAAAAVLTLLLAPAPASAIDLFPGRDETELADVLEIVVTKRALLAIDARGGGQTEADLERGEEVLVTASKGRVGVAVTDRRLLAVTVTSAAWQEERYRKGESPPERVLLGDRVAITALAQRVVGFDGRSGNLVEGRLGPHERLVAMRAGDNVAVAVTSRRALGLSPFVGGFFDTSLRLGERVESLSAKSNVATLRTSQRILIFRASTRTWEERRLDLD